MEERTFNSEREERERGRERELERENEREREREKEREREREKSSRDAKKDSANHFSTSPIDRHSVPSQSVPAIAQNNQI